MKPCSYVQTRKLFNLQLSAPSAQNHDFPSCPFMHTWQMLAGEAHKQAAPSKHSSAVSNMIAGPICWSLLLKQQLYNSLPKPMKRGRFSRMHVKYHSISTTFFPPYLPPLLGCPAHICSSPRKEVQLSSPTEIRGTSADRLCLPSIVLCEIDKVAPIFAGKT